MRRPLDGARRITGNAASHAEYNVSPATDYGADMSEVIRAPFGGWVTRWWSNTGGYTVAITTNWVKFTVQHLSAYAGKSAGQVNEGDVIGYVGNTGSSTSGPHVHCWIILIESGQRISFEQYLVNQGWETAALWSSVPGPHESTTTASSGTTTPTQELEEEDDDMKASQVHWKRKKDGLTQRALFVPGTSYWLTWQESGAAIANGFATNVGTGNSTAITESMAIAMERASAALLPKGVDLGSVTVEVDSKELAATIEASLADDFAAIPTAAENADATRAKFTTSPLS
jgi:hypothetical protein